MLRSRENWIEGAPREAKIGPRGAPQKLRKPGRQKDTLEQERVKQMAPKWERQLGFFRIPSVIFLDFCFASFVRWFLNGYV